MYSLCQRATDHDRGRQAADPVGLDGPICTRAGATTATPGRLAPTGAGEAERTAAMIVEEPCDSVGRCSNSRRRDTMAGGYGLIATGRPAAIPSACSAAASRARTRRA